MPFMRIAIVTCLIYLLLSFLISIYFSMKHSDNLLVLSSIRYYLVYGAVWALSFTAALRLEHWLIHFLRSP